MKINEIIGESMGAGAVAAVAMPMGGMQMRTPPAAPKKTRKKKKKTNEESPCWKGYKQIGMKKKGGKSVPNCVPVDKK